MAPTTDDGRSAGGKIVRRRRRLPTPYDRPLNPTPQSPNWFRGLISPAKTVAGKLLSSFWNPDTWSSPSSSSSSSDSDSQPVSEDGVEDNSDHYETSFDEAELNEKYTSGMIKSFSKDSQLALRKSEVKRLIEQLLVLEKFSRDEADRLINIINSRVVDIFQTEGLDAGTDNGTPDVRSRAVKEAKKWLEESLKSNSDRALSALGTDHVREFEVGSPVNVAKSYMRDRPLWASPSVQHRELRSPSSAVPNQLFTEMTPHLKVGSLSAGSWNIQEEIRKVRSKATEDMLRTRQSTKLDLSSFAPEYRTTKTSLMAGQAIELLNTSDPSDLGKTQDGTCTEVSPSHKPDLISEQNQDPEAIQTVAGGGAAFKSHHDARLQVESEQHLDTHPRLSENAVEGETEVLSASNANGSSASQIRSSYDDVGVDGTCHLLTETSVEVPVNEDPSPQRTTAPNLKSDSVSVSEKPVAKKPSRYVKKGRGRGK